MITQKASKKFTNVSIVSLKRFGRCFEMMVYPNTLYEYKNNPSAENYALLPNKKIYRNAAIGDLASAQDIALFNLSQDDVCRIILTEGHEQKPLTTVHYELSQVERQIVEAIRSKVTYNGSYVSNDLLLKAIKSVCDIKNTSPKKQIGAIIKKLEAIGFERVTFRVRCDSSQICYDGVEKHDGYVLVKSTVLPDFLKYCTENRIIYVIERNDTVEEEEIC